MTLNITDTQLNKGLCITLCVIMQNVSFDFSVMLSVVLCCAECCAECRGANLKCSQTADLPVKLKSPTNYVLNVLNLSG